ncbi:hypothetical protein ACTMU2_07850 [Cupriavidus basilensis]
MLLALIHVLRPASNGRRRRERQRHEGDGSFHHGPCLGSSLNALNFFTSATL